MDLKNQNLSISGQKILGSSIETKSSREFEKIKSKNRKSTKLTILFNFGFAIHP